jgi:hypothetical protein
MLLLAILIVLIVVLIFVLMFWPWRRTHEVVLVDRPATYGNWYGAYGQRWGPGRRHWRRR